MATRLARKLSIGMKLSTSPLFLSTRVLNFEVENSTRFVCHNDCRQYSSIEFGMMDENLHQILIYTRVLKVSSESH